MAKPSVAAADVVIIGGGLIGLSIAWHLIRAGIPSVSVVEQGEAGSPGQASPVAAGMLAPLAEAHGDGPLVRLGWESLQQYPEFIAAVQKDSGGIDPHLRGPGMLRLAESEAEMAALERDARWQRDAFGPQGAVLHLLSAREVRRLEPALSPEIVGGVLSPRERQVEPRLLLIALREACQRRGVLFCRGTALAIEPRGDSVEVKTAGGETVGGDSLVIAGGAWSEAIGQMLAVSLPIAPVRGQILTLRPEKDTPLLRHTLYAGGCGYLVPRTDGRVIAGATEEPHVGFDSRVTVGGVRQVLEAGCLLVPSLANAAFLSAQVGLRPAAPDGLPVLGRLPGWSNAYVATGHFRNGVLLTPITGSLIASLLQKASLSQESIDLFAPFRVERFPQAQAEKTEPGAALS